MGRRLQRFIRAGLAKLEKFQTDEGGFSLWIGGQAEPYLTAFALWGLKLASDAGHKLPPGMIDRGHALPARAARARRERSRRACTASSASSGAARSRCTCWACSTAPIPGYANKLLERKAELPRFGEAFLARALALNLGAQHPAVTGLLDDLAHAAETKGADAIIREPGGEHLRWYMSDDVRTTAIATDAFLDLRPSEPMLPRLVKGLFGERQQRAMADDAGQPLRAGRAHALREVAPGRQRHRRRHARRQEGAGGRLPGPQHAHPPGVHRGRHGASRRRRR